MTVETDRVPNIPQEAQAIVWKIFSIGASPLTRPSSYDAIEPVVRRHLSSNHADLSIAAIRGWFESFEDRHWLRPEKRESVAAMILEGVGAASGESQVWAIGSIDADIMTRSIRSLCSCEQIDSLVEVALDALEGLCNREIVLDASHLDRSYSIDTRTTRRTIVREGRLETYRQLDSHGLDLVFRALHPTAGNLLALVIALRPQEYEGLMKRLDHPVVQARAAHHMLGTTLHSDHRATLGWISRGSCDGLIALAIVHTLNTVNKLDDDMRLADGADSNQYPPSTELRPRQDDLDTAAANLLSGLVDGLALLDPPACARWIGELLSGATYVLRRNRGHEMPHRVSQLERACTAQCVSLFREKWSAELLPELIAGLRHTPRISWTRHLADIAWDLREADSARAMEVARAALHEHERQIAAELERDHVFLEWHDWDHREWLKCLGIALAMSDEEIDLLHWVRTQCCALPLSVWDAEEDNTAFSSADRVVQHRFVVALHALPVLKLLGRPVDPSRVRAIAKTLWSHLAFAGKHCHSLGDAPVAAEYAARYTIEYGTPTDAWLLEQVLDPGIPPRSLWALIDQRTRQHCREGGRRGSGADLFLTEVIRRASDRFRGGAEFNLDELRFWGLLWLAVDAVDEAEQTVQVILTFPLRSHDRTYRILALKLLANVARSRRLSAKLADSTASLYRQLWPGHEPEEERSDRQQVDEMLEQAVHRIL